MSAQEILISTPRRFGKTISVSMFAAALLYSCAGIELSIYSTCKRISQKLLRNVVKFLDLIYLGLGCERMKVIRANCEVRQSHTHRAHRAHTNRKNARTQEIHIQGPEGPADVRVTNSYPSKVSARLLKSMLVFTLEKNGGGRFFNKIQLLNPVPLSQPRSLAF